MKRVEALAMAIAREHESFDPSSEAFQTLNPGLLRPFVNEFRVQLANENGIRKFNTFQAGWTALVNDLNAKCSGRTKSHAAINGLGPESSLKRLIPSFGYLNMRRIVEFLQDALSDKAINEHTKLEFFLEGTNGNGNGHPGSSR